MKKNSPILTACIKSSVLGLIIYKLVIIFFSYYGIGLNENWYYFFQHLGLPILTLIFIFFFFIKGKINGIAILYLFLIPFLMFFIAKIILTLHIYVLQSIFTQKLQDNPKINKVDVERTQGIWLNIYTNDGYRVIFHNVGLKDLEKQKHYVLPYAVNTCNIYPEGIGRTGKFGIFKQRYYSIIESIDHAEEIFEEVWVNDQACQVDHPGYVPRNSR